MLFRSSRTNPRQGRFVKIFPAVIIYILYLVLLNVARSGIEKEVSMALLRFWSVHLIFLCIAAVLIAWNSGWRPGLPRHSKISQDSGAA